MTLEQAISEPYTKTKVEKLSTSTLRLRALSEWCMEELEKRGLAGSVRETPLPGCGRSKQWDVAWIVSNKPRLAISLKSLLENLSGCVPNRIDDLIGECANAQMILPELVIGYICVFDTAKDALSSKHGMTWLQVREEPSLTIGTHRAVLDPWHYGVLSYTGGGLLL